MRVLGARRSSSATRAAAQHPSVAAAGLSGPAHAPPGARRRRAHPRLHRALRDARGRRRADHRAGGGAGARRRRRGDARRARARSWSTCSCRRVVQWFCAGRLVDRRARACASWSERPPGDGVRSGRPRRNRCGRVRDRTPMAADAHAPCRPAPAPSAARQARTRRVLVVALVLSLALHLAVTAVAGRADDRREPTPLTATITELPPPPVPRRRGAGAQGQAASPGAPRRSCRRSTRRPRRRRRRPTWRPPSRCPSEAAAPPARAPPRARRSRSCRRRRPRHRHRQDAAAARRPRLQGVLRTRGFLIGDARYRFEHANQRYRIATIGEARGLAALVLRGQGKIESRGLITADGPAAAASCASSAAAAIAARSRCSTGSRAS